MRSRLLGGMLLALGLTVATVGEATADVILAGVTLPASAEADGRRLRLGGCAVREMWWMDLHTLAVYVPDAPIDAPIDVATMLRPGTPKLVRMDVVYDGEVPGCRRIGATACVRRSRGSSCGRSRTPTAT